MRPITYKVDELAYLCTYSCNCNSAQLYVRKNPQALGHIGPPALVRINREIFPLFFAQRGKGGGVGAAAVCVKKKFG